MSDLACLPAGRLAELIRSRKVLSTEVVRACLHRIAKANPQINALVQLAPHALSHAEAADAALARGDLWGALHGVPFTVKDVCETAGIVSAAGLPERARFVPQQDAVVVARMKAAGGILLGKTNCPPGGGGGLTDNTVYGRTNNPYDPERTPGGSSGGCAAAVASGCTPLSIGSDSGGSLRLPAHYCGVATLKATTGRVPNTGVFNHPGGFSDPRTQIGPVARSVDDLWLGFAAIAGPDGQDAGVVPVALGDPSAVSIAGLRVACYVDDGQSPPTLETAAAVQAAAGALSRAGLNVEGARPASLDLSRDITERYWGMSRLSGEQIEHLFTDWDCFRTAMLGFMQSYDVILCPVDAGPAHRHDQPEGPLKFNYTLPFSLTGWPCVAVRAGTSAEGLPIGVQVVARPWREDVAVAVARVVEVELGGWRRPFPRPTPLPRPLP